MNQKLIETFSEMADSYADNKTYSQGEYHPDWHQVRDQHFAQLVVTHCATIAAMLGVTNHDNDDIVWACEQVVKDINDHFGVEW
jgi:hypothetical protein